MMVMMEGRGCQDRGEGDWSAEMTTWTMSGDKRSREITGPDLNNSGDNLNNSEINDCFYCSFVLIGQILNKMVKLIGIIFIRRKFLMCTQGFLWFILITLTDIDASESKCANSFSVTKQIIMTQDSVSGGMKKYRTQSSFIPGAPQPCHYRVSVPRKSRQKLEQRADVSQCRN